MSGVKKKNNKCGGACLYSASIAAIGVALTVAVVGVVGPEQPAQQQQPTSSDVTTQPAPPLTREQAKLLLKTLDEAASHGFRPGEFGPADLSALLDSHDEADRARGEALLKTAIVRYAAAQHGGRIPADRFLGDWSIRPVSYDAQADFDFALAQDRLEAWLASLPPPFERYRELRTALGQYRDIAARGGWTPIADGPALKPGVNDPRVVQLRRRLAAENPPGALDIESPVYDERLAAAVAAAQARYGLEPDGVVDKADLAAFNVPIAARIAQIAANMERWRWMPRSWPTTRVEVNIPDAHLTVFSGGQAVDQMRVVVGAPDNKTPMLASAIHSVVFNPAWNVPKSIATKELAPKGEGYLRRNGFVWISDGAGGSRLQQRPGPGNSLGRIKFDFDNPFGVYLHDTNARNVFELDARSVSHGCVRVERPQDLAAALLGEGWDQPRIMQVIDSAETERAPLPQKIPVMLLYWTVFASPDGQVNFRDDLYGWDERLSAMLNLGRIAA